MLTSSAFLDTLTALALFLALLGGPELCFRLGQRARQRRAEHPDQLATIQAAILGLLAPVKRFIAQLLAGSTALALIGCASFKPILETPQALLARALHQEDDRFKVSVAVPSVQETAMIFDRKLDKKNIQPVWLRIENRLDTPAYFLPNLLDSEYYAPLEVAYQYHSGWCPGRNTDMDLFFLTYAMPSTVPPRSERAGFVFTHLDLGRKQLSVSISPDPGAWHEDRYTFVVEVPGLATESWDRNWERLGKNSPVVDCDDERLQVELERLPRATASKDGTKEGDPLNLVLIGTEADLAAMAGCGWDQAERLTTSTAWHTFKSFLFGSRYRYAPMSSLYTFGRQQDLAFQKARSSVKLRNHLRLWITPLRYHGKPVWIGQISRDIGVRWTLRTANLTTHKINPNVDEARGYLIRDLVLGQAARWWAFVKGAEAAPYDQPRHNLTGDPYYTDGLRAVIELSSKTVKPHEVVFKKWEIPPEKSFPDQK
jgi:hypothetical protein